MAVYGPMGAEELYHYGIPRKSGRYPYGSGKEPYQSNPAMAKKAIAKKKPETFWEKRRKAQAAKQREKTKVAKAKAEAKTVKANEAKPASQKAKEMSDEDLVRAINRLRLEQTYLNMVAPPAQQKQTISKGKQFIDKLKANTKDAADLATNINTLTKGITGTYANVRAIQKMLDGKTVKPDDEKKKG